MRKEASLESWKELYEVTGNIKKLAPWEYLWDTDLIAISLPEREEPIFCSIMGRGGTYYGISAYIGFEGLADFDLTARSEETGLPVEYIMFDQSNLSCYFGSRDELPVEQRKLIKNLDLKFRGNGNWLYYKKFFSKKQRVSRFPAFFLSQYKKTKCHIKHLHILLPPL